ncbi:hypothetical protein BT63DRAFT_453792 [Microthyrium microscopicum]|uniref:Uncharacterized protein n=1 Tax=Microthyrium microscopicum TaxID=703497 RepID=A0A6A6UI72_9PEZI|nr:hypothetical protein BT63DRAFT_453792 [Microthyrium microscopicum]
MELAKSHEEDKYSFAVRLREEKKFFEQAAVEGHDNTLNETIESYLWAISQWAKFEASDFHDGSLRIFNRTVIQAGKSYHYRNAKQIEIVLYILSLREMGPFARPSVSHSGEQTFVAATTTTTGARFSTDLPFFVEDIEEEWMNDYLTLDSDSRDNLIGFIGRLVSVGLPKRLGLCALRLFHDALEAPRRLRALDAGKEVPELNLLQAIGAWLITSNWKTWTLPSRGVQFGTALAYPGVLACSAGVTANGFSAERWQFWVDRVREIRSQLSTEKMKELKMDHFIERLSDNSVKSVSV